MIAIIDSGVGNVRSVANALDYLHIDFKVTLVADDIKQCQKIIFPGVGAFKDGMASIKKSGLLNVLQYEALENKKPYLGICLGMQLLAEIGEEDGVYPGLGWIKGKVRKISDANSNIKLPHIGWNNVQPKSNQVLFKDLAPDPTFYFVHSYVIDPVDSHIITATSTYGEMFTASIQYHNIYGVQFHPEKSHRNGLQLLKNFVTLA